MSKFVLVGRKFMMEMHLRQRAAYNKSEFTYSVWSIYKRQRNKEHKNLQKNLRF